MAEADLLGILEFIGEDDPDAAFALVQMIREKAEGLRVRPRLYRAGRVSGTREMVVHHNYIVVYSIDADVVEILSVKHARQQWPE
ncbi:type II toxin-antitoxin system RelE/ParE family toxin [Burkholderia pseudomallei]|uniref:type II toxin-antitoxin system RelE/ParE family toxin n=1 Tax=Burkholderia pseudomallei TaxID=28450 RepID=UPI00053210C0|nr:type II toxin-antitoxin system RelE/ParE family toxin [Burkholderia pseudomallei]KGS50920.1 plasmid stabilization system family protein [Burkholderia pseudomallei MSHR5492]MBY7651219.1 type II toxin-antitoxin system RelE/ParE family toxin [Burkholderia pseudomallei]ONC27439.1 addiction module antitoxin [Burkholderia pseudomallei]QUN81873.1 type II toxin-antitoxin system RelE/ParE family toxin [Burkholderia pseudomallei]QUN93718.1 type II toxin-antitoxin system RelE/ParE family toxin [Burkho